MQYYQQLSDQERWNQVCYYMDLMHRAEFAHMREFYVRILMQLRKRKAQSGPDHAEGEDRAAESPTSRQLIKTIGEAYCHFMSGGAGQKHGPPACLRLRGIQNML